MNRRWAPLLVWVAVGVGCAASDPSEEPAARGAAASPADSPVAPEAPACEMPFGAPNRRFTRFELAHAIQDVFGVDASALTDLPRPHASIGIRPDVLVSSHLDVSEAFLDAYRERIDPIARAAAKELLGNCEAPQLACASEALGRAARRLLRRPVAPSEPEEWLRVDGSTEVRLTSAIRTVLLRDEFYVLERELEPLDAATSARERATRLALTLWSSVPDEELLDAAEADGLSSREGFEAQVSRMMDDPRFERFVREFARQWLELDRPPTFRATPFSVPEDRPELLEEVLDEVASLLGASLDLPVATLLRSDAEPGGLLVSRAVTTAVSSPIDVGGNENWLGRGLVIQSAFLCRTWPLASVYPLETWQDNWLLNPESPAPRPDEVALLSERTRQAPCRNCHRQLETLGAALSAYDGFGARSRADAPLPPPELPHDATSLAAWLDATRRFEPCVATKLASYVLGRAVLPERRAEDRCVVDWLARGEGGPPTLRSWLLQIVASAEFRRPQLGPVAVIRDTPDPLPDVGSYRRPLELPDAPDCDAFDAQAMLARACGDSACHGPGGDGGFFVGGDETETRWLLDEFRPDPTGPCASHQHVLGADGLLVSKVSAAEGVCGAPMPIAGGPRSLEPDAVACLVRWVGELPSPRASD